MSSRQSSRPPSRPSTPMSPVGQPSSFYGLRQQKPSMLHLFMEYKNKKLIRMLAVASAVLFFGGMWMFYAGDGMGNVSDSGDNVGKFNNGGGGKEGKGSGGNVGIGGDKVANLGEPEAPSMATTPFDAEYHPKQPPDWPSPPGAEDVVLIIKTGGTVLWQRLPVHIVTTLKRVPNYLIFSDVADKVGDVVIHDSLKDVKPKIRLEHEQFEIYRILNGLVPVPTEISMSQASQSASKEEMEAYTYKGEGLPGNRPGNLDISQLKLKGGWDLDKYKNVPILYQTFRAYPNKKWYVFIDADTAVFWGGLVKYLTTELDHTKPMYLGAPTLLGDELFAHGGTGYILSHEAARMAVVDHPEHEHGWEDYAINDCCGDHILGRVMDKLGIKLKGERPHVQGEPWYGLRWDKGTWCSSIWTFHHVSPADVQMLWEFERMVETTLFGRKKDQVTYSDMYHYFAKPHLTSIEPMWDNLSNDDWFERPDYTPSKQTPVPTKEEVSKMKDTDKKKWTTFLSYDAVGKASVESTENCAKLCESKDDCLQWRWAKGTCVLNKSVIFGKKDPNPKGEKEAWWSGWALEKIEKLRAGQKCEKGRQGGFPAEVRKVKMMELEKEEGKVVDEKEEEEEEEGEEEEVKKVGVDEGVKIPASPPSKSGEEEEKEEKKSTADEKDEEIEKELEEDVPLPPSGSSPETSTTATTSEGGAEVEEEEE